MIKSITVTNYLGESIKLELAFPEKSGFAITSIDGLGPSKSTINVTDFSSMDGSLYNSSRTGTRNIVMNLIFCMTSAEDARHLTYKYFPIKKNVELLIETDTRLCKTSGYVESNEPDIFSSQEGCQISILCPDPNLYSAGENGVQITIFYGVYDEFEFPFSNEDPFDPNGYGATSQIKTTQGKNLFDGVLQAGAWNGGDGTFISSSNYASNTNKVNVVAGQTYTLSLVSSKVHGGTIVFYNNGAFVSSISLTATFTIPANANQVSFDLFNMDAIIPSDVTNIQLELGSVATAYAPFVPNSPRPDYPAPITGVSKATINGTDYATPQTLYDGDSYNFVTGQGTATKKYVIFDGSTDETYNCYIESNKKTVLFETNNFINNASNINSSAPQIVSSHFVSNVGILSNNIECIGYTFGGNFLRIRILKSRLTSWSDSWTSTQKNTAFKTWLSANPVTVVYQLATPVQITGPKLIDVDFDFIEFGDIQITTEQTVYYDGDSETGVVITLHAIGDVGTINISNVATHELFTIEDFRLADTTGDKMKAGDTIIISTVKNDKYIRLLRNGIYRNILNAVNRDADWFQLVKGDNLFVYTDSSGNHNLQFTIENRIAYEGV